MSPAPPRPNMPVLKSGQKIRNLETRIEELREELDAHRQLLAFIHEHLVVPWPKTTRLESMCFHQREIATWIKGALRPEPDWKPADTLEFLIQYLPETPYEVEQ